MSIQWESAGGPPLKVKVPPDIPVRALVAVVEVTLAGAGPGGEVPRASLRDFYEGVLGLVFVRGDEQTLLFMQQVRRIVVRRDLVEPGRVGFLIQQFGEALVKLRQRQIACEVLHTDGGLSRMAIVRDPAGNWVHLIETRPL